MSYPENEPPRQGAEQEGADSEAGATVELESMRKELETARSERDLLKDQLARTLADLQNIRKRHAKEMDDSRRRAIEALSAELLPVLDNFHLALSAHERQETGTLQAESHSMLEGLKMVRSLLQGTLERHGLTEVSALGEAFDPSCHEAVGIDDRGAHAHGTITEVLQRGYMVGDRLVRTAKVLVAGQGGVESNKDNETGNTSGS